MWKLANVPPGQFRVGSTWLASMLTMSFCGLGSLGWCSGSPGGQFANAIGAVQPVAATSAAMSFIRAASQRSAGDASGVL